MDETQLKEILSRFKDISIVVIGDFFLDKYLQIDINKEELSIETGLKAYQVVDIRTSPGAAGTITNNLRSIGVNSIIAVGFVGRDGNGHDLIEGLKASGVKTQHVLKTRERITPTYIKPVYLGKDGLKELNRFDIKNYTPTPRIIEDTIIEKLNILSGEVNGIVVLDQLVESGCGVITDRVRKVLSDLMSQNRDLIVYADSRTNMGGFSNMIIKCNHLEAVNAMFPDTINTQEPGEEIIIKAGHVLSRKTGRPVFITHGKHGQLVFDGDRFEKIPAVPVSGPIDICGAGDATTSGIISALCCGSSLSDAALLGNIISSITIQKVGETGTATQAQIVKRYCENFN